MGRIVTSERSVRLFENPILERLSRVHPVLPICIWGPIALGLTWAGVRGGLSAASAAGLLLAGLFSWTLAEYALHRWIFHWQPRGERLRKLWYPVHELHHDVQEWDRLVAPPLMSVPLFVAFFLLFRLLLGSPDSYPFLGGFVVGYLAYDYVHLYTHFAKPENRIGKGLRRRHLQHHFAWPDRWYGISSPLWDHVFRTHVRAGERPTRGHPK